MCDPTLIMGAGALASLGGTAMSAMSNSAAASAQSQAAQEAARVSAAARAAERARQANYDAEATARWQDNIAATSPAASIPAAQAAADQITQTADTVSDPALVGLLPGQDHISAEQRVVIARQIADGVKTARERTAALAKMAGWDRMGADWGVANTRAGSDLALNRSMARGSLSVSGNEATIPAATVTPGSGAMLGQALAGLGSIGAAYGASKGGLNGLAGLFSSSGGTVPLTDTWVRGPAGTFFQVR